MLPDFVNDVHHLGKIRMRLLLPQQVRGSPGSPNRKRCPQRHRILDPSVDQWQAWLMGVSAVLQQFLFRQHRNEASTDWPTPVSWEPCCWFNARRKMKENHPQRVCLFTLIAVVTLAFSKYPASLLQDLFPSKWLKIPIKAYKNITGKVVQPWISQLITRTLTGCLCNYHEQVHQPQCRRGRDLI